jgi:hypothetical protein
MALGNMEHDGARLEQRKIGFFISWNFPEGMKRSMRRLLHFTERKKTNLVTLTNFFKRPPNDHVTRQSPATIRRPPEGGDGGPHGKARSDCMTSLGVMIFRIVALRVLPLCGRTTGGPHDTRPNFSRSVESEDAGRHCLAQLRWIEADRPEEFFASAAATPPKAAAFL